MTNLPAPDSRRVEQSSLAPADLGEVVRLYSLRNWVEQSYKQVKHALGWVRLGWVGLGTVSGTQRHGAAPSLDAGDVRFLLCLVESGIRDKMRTRNKTKGSLKPIPIPIPIPIP